MAAAKKKGLPEITVSATENADLVTIAKNALALRTQISALEAQLTEAKKELADKAKVLRATKEATGSYIGLIRIIDGEQTTNPKILLLVVSCRLSLAACLVPLLLSGLKRRHIDLQARFVKRRQCQTPLDTRESGHFGATAEKRSHRGLSLGGRGFLA